MKIVGKILKYAFVALIIFVYGFFMLRICTSSDPEEMTEYIWTDTVAAAYQSDPASVTILSVEPADTIDADGLFKLSAVYTSYSEAIDFGQLQVTVRYNNSTVKKTEELYSLDSIAGEPFIYILTDDTGASYTSYSYVSGERNVYNYRQLVFQNVDFSSASTLTLSMYYIGDVNIEEPLCALRVMTSGSETERASAAEEPLELPSPTERKTLYTPPAYIVK